MGKGNSSRRKSIVDNTKSALKKRHAGIMTQQPQAMEGVTELGRDGKYLSTLIILQFIIFIILQIDIVAPSPSKFTPSKGVTINNKVNKQDQGMFIMLKNHMWLVINWFGFLIAFNPIPSVPADWQWSTF